LQLAILSPEKTTQAFFAFYQFENFFNLDLLHQAFRFQPFSFQNFIDSIWSADLPFAPFHL
jgi:hypothetical protein